MGWYGMVRFGMAITTPSLLIKKKVRHREGAADILDDITHKFQLVGRLTQHMLFTRGTGGCCTCWPTT